MKDVNQISVLTRGQFGMIAGVCSGLAEHFGLRAGGLRVAFVLFSIFFALPVLAYLVLSLILPKYPSSQAMARQLRRRALQRKNLSS